MSIQLRFIDHHSDHVDVIVGPFEGLRMTYNALRDSYDTIVAVFDLVNHCWYIAPGFDPTHVPETYEKFVIEPAPEPKLTHEPADPYCPDCAERLAQAECPECGHAPHTGTCGATDPALSQDRKSYTDDQDRTSYVPVFDTVVCDCEGDDPDLTAALQGGWDANYPPVEGSSRQV